VVTAVLTSSPSRALFLSVMTMARLPLSLWRFGLIEYREAWRWQETMAAAVGAGEMMETLALLQHPPVFTLGPRTRPEHLLASKAAIRALGADVIEVDRGGDVTFHGPGQVVGYPIVALRKHSMGPVDYVRALESTIIDTLDRYGVASERHPGLPGVWVGNTKIAALGIRVRKGVTTHGFALNVAPDLGWFANIVPCGLAGAGVTSMAQILGFTPDLGEVETEIAAAFARKFDVDLVAGGSSATPIETGRPVLAPEATRRGESLVAGPWPREERLPGELRELSPPQRAEGTVAYAR
jgi:lipoyl(octanoyl) transferase